MYFPFSLLNILSGHKRNQKVKMYCSRDFCFFQPPCKKCELWSIDGFGNVYSEADEGYAGSGENVGAEMTRMSRFPSYKCVSRSFIVI